MHLSKILVPVDFSPPSTLAVNHGAALARKFGAKLSLLHVVESPRRWFTRFRTEAEKVETQRRVQAEKMLPILVSPEDWKDLDVRFLVKAGDVEETIQNAVHEENADAVVMGTHGRTLFGRLLIGSVTQELLRKLGVPVLRCAGYHVRWSSSESSLGRTWRQVPIKPSISRWSWRSRQGRRLSWHTPSTRDRL